MRNIIKINENGLKLIIKKVIKEQYEYNPNRLYRRESVIKRIKHSGPEFIQKYIKSLPHLKKEGSDEVWTKIPQVVWENIPRG
jgi:cobalamin biosynthesis Co2+ chelatase CbiK